MRNHTILIVVALTAVVAVVQDSFAQDTDTPTVAVMDFTGLMVGEAGNSVSLGKAVSAMLVTEFSGREGIQVIERAQLNDMLTEQQLRFGGFVDEGSAVEVGRLLGAQYMFYGQVASIAGNLRIDIRAVDVETSEVISVLKKMDQTSALLEVIVWVADEFSGELDLTPPSARPAIEPIPIQATIEFSRGVDLEDKGEVEQAMGHYRAALEHHPGHRDAQRALERLSGGGA